MPALSCLPGHQAVGHVRDLWVSASFPAGQLGGGAPGLRSFWESALPPEVESSPLTHEPSAGALLQPHTWKTVVPVVPWTPGHSGSSGVSIEAG